VKLWPFILEKTKAQALVAQAEELNRQHAIELDKVKAWERDEAFAARKKLTDAHALRELQPTGSECNVGRWTCDAPRIWATEPDMARMVHGLPGRVDRERALGNSVVPQQAEVVGYVIRELTAARSASGSAERKETE